MAQPFNNRGKRLLFMSWSHGTKIELKLEYKVFLKVDHTQNISFNMGFALELVRKSLCEFLFMQWKHEFQSFQFLGTGATMHTEAIQLQQLHTTIRSIHGRFFKLDLGLALCCFCHNNCCFGKVAPFIFSVVIFPNSHPYGCGSIGSHNNVDFLQNNKIITLRVLRVLLRKETLTLKFLNVLLRYVIYDKAMV